MKKHTLLLLSTIFWGAALVMLVLYFTKKQLLYIGIAFGLIVLGGIFKFLFKYL